MNPLLGLRANLLAQQVWCSWGKVRQGFWEQLELLDTSCRQLDPRGLAGDGFSEVSHPGQLYLVLFPQSA